MGINSGTKGLLVITASAMLAFTGCGGEKKVQETAPIQGSGPNAGAPASQAQQQPAPQGEQAALPAGHPPMDKTMQAASDSTAPVGALPSGHPAAAGGHEGAKVQRELKLSDEVKARWSEAKMEVTDNSSKGKEVLTLKVGSTANLKKQGFKLKVEALVPDYSISENRIESRSNEPRNPAVLVELFEGDKSVAKGWIFKNFTDFNSYRDDRVGLQLLAPGPEKK